VPNELEENGQADNGQADNGQADNGQADNGQEENGQEENGQEENGQAENGQAENGQEENGQEEQVESAEPQSDEPTAATACFQTTPLKTGVDGEGAPGSVAKQSQPLEIEHSDLFGTVPRLEQFEVLLPSQPVEVLSQITHACVAFVGEDGQTSKAFKSPGKPTTGK